MYRTLLFLALCGGVVAKTAYLEFKWDSTVGVNLQDFPACDRTRIAEHVKGQSEEYWKLIAIHQVRLTLSYFIYDRDPPTSLPEKDKWTITFTSPPEMRTIGKFLHIVRDFTFRTISIGEGDSFEDPNWKEGLATFEPINFPVDPEGILSKTGYACSYEIDGGVKDVDAEAVHWFYADWTDIEHVCENRYYHPEMTCAEALDAYTGRVEVVMVIQPLNLTLLTQAQKDELVWFYTNVTRTETPDLTPINLNEQMWVEWKYFGPNHCALNKNGDNCMNATGWRKLLRYGAGSINIGKKEVEVGDPNRTEYRDGNLGHYDECHKHFHFVAYANVSLNLAPNNLPKRSFCVISTWKYLNQDGVQFHNRRNCSYQGVEPGWGDEYPAHYDCQWVDLTEASHGPGSLSIQMNAQGVLCEGTLIKESNGSLILEPTGETYNGKPIKKPKCNQAPGAFDNNKITVPVVNSKMYEASTLAPCPYTQYSVYRDCGLAVQDDMITCKPGKMVQLKLSNSGPTQIVCVCESSVKFGHSLYCDATWSLVNIVLGPGEERRVFFKCPDKRDDGNEPGGFYSIMTGGVLEADGSRPIKFETCGASSTATLKMPYRHIQEDFGEPVYVCQSP